MNQSWRQSKQKSLNCPWLPSLFMLWPLVNYLVYFTTSSLRNHYEWERVLDHVWEDGLCKIHSIKCKMFKNCVWQLKCSKIVFLSLKCLKCRISFFIKHFTRSVDYNIFVATTYLLRPPSKHRQRCLAPAERKVVPPRVRGPLPPLPLCNFLCSTATSTVTFHPNTFTCRTSVWNRGSWNLPLSTPSSCLPQSIPDYRHYYA